MPESTICSVFEECQRGLQHHGKLCKQLKQIAMGMDYEEFFKEFLHYLKYFLIVFSREPAVERAIDFVARFGTSGKMEEDKENHPENQENKDGEMDDFGQEKFLNNFFDFLLQHHNARDKGVRFRCCQLISKLLIYMGDEAEIDDSLYDRLYECMQQRVKDKFPVIRVQAVQALARLQDPQDPDCPIIRAYTFLMGHDPNVDVRKAVLVNIAASTQTLPDILERTRDVKCVVRKMAFRVLAEKVHIKALTIAERVKLLDTGLKDRDEKVQEACTMRLLQAWLLAKKGNILDLLASLDVENSLETSELALTMLLQKTPPAELIQNFDLLDDNLVIPVEKLTAEGVLYWRCLCQHMKSLGTSAEELLDRVLPSTLPFNNYIQQVSDGLKETTDEEEILRKEFILQQVLCLAKLLDLSDQAGRQQQEKVIHEMLMADHISDQMVPYILPLHQLLHPAAESRVQQLVENISDIREPITVVEKKLSADEQRKADLQIAKVRFELNQLRSDVEDAVKSQNFSLAAELKDKVDKLEELKQTLTAESQPQTQEIRTEKNDPITLLKCLTIAAEMLQRVHFRSLPPTLRSLMEALIIPGIQNADPAVRNMAVKALGLCCLLCVDTSRDHLMLLLQVLQIDHESVQVTALKCIFDMIHIFGLEAFEAQEAESESAESAVIDDESSKATGSESLFSHSTAAESASKQAEKEDASKTANSILNILIRLLDSQSSDLRTVAAEGLAKLLLSARVVSSKLLSRLLLLWYNPVSEDDLHLRHCLGAFFPVFAFAGRANQELVGEAFLPTLRTLFNAPSSSPLAKIKADNVAELLVELTSPRHLIQNQQNSAAPVQDPGPHLDLAVQISNEVLSNPNSIHVKLLCRILNALNLKNAELTQLKELQVLADEMAEEVKERYSIKSLEKYSNTVRVLLEQLEEPSQTATQPTIQVTADTPPSDSQTASQDTTIGPQGDTGKRRLLSQDETLLDVDVEERTLSQTSSVGNTTQESIQDSVQESIQESVQESVQESISESVQESVTSDTTPSEEKTSSPSTVSQEDSSQTQNDSQCTRKTRQTRKTTAKTVTPASSRKTRSRRRQTTPVYEDSSDSELEDRVFNSPTPVKRSARSKRTKARSGDDVKMKLSQKLLDDDGDSMDKELMVCLERIPLSDVENQVI